ncbi:MAG: peptidoglycan-binding protein [Acidimicrobiales bacterium]|nr:peptidoglycan-binding protein [Acidimicrobiales bacterium]MCB9394468.1 peptidoglycan-binding protein [Acidimicrobiaceae bacterium]
MRAGGSFLVACATVLGAVAGVAPTSLGTVETALAADDTTAWVLPTMPAKCSDAQKTSGNVAGCLLDGSGAPEARGWPSPPFPTPEAGPVPTEWVPLQRGDAGSRVTVLQQALVDHGVTTFVDGSFGPATETSVKTFQSTNGLEPTGIVDQATAEMLGILETAIGGPFPPTGWNWLGWGYNKSPALADWETLLVGNTSKFGPVAVNQVRSMPEAQPLFEGFLREIVARGYKINDLGTYVFRCTSNSRKSCEGLTKSSLSNHSWGLAVDMNTTANPELTYRGVDGATACATPMKSDIPQWVVQVAETWGLYWGGYGWGGGCASPQAEKTSVLRDTMHFEFRGTPAQAKAIAAFRASGVPAVPPTRTCLPVADDAGAVTTRCLTDAEQPRAGWRTVVQTTAPAGATAAVVNITLVGAAGAGFVTAEACSAISGPRASSNGNATPNIVSANLSVVPVDAQGRFCLFQSQPMDTVVDVQGFFVPSAAAGTAGAVLHVVPPQRLLDTRTDTFCAAGGSCGRQGPVAAGTELAVTTPLVPANAVAMLTNLTVTAPASAGYLTADSCVSLTPGPQTRSNTNFTAGATVANLAVVPSSSASGGSQICTWSSATAQKIVDVQGYFAPASTGGWGFQSQTAARLLDTRTGDRPGAGAMLRVQGPAGASAALVNLTLTDARAPGYVTADRCSALVPGPQTKSNGNTTVGRITANVAVVPLDADGSFCVYTSNPTHVVVDLQGTFAPGADLRFVPVTPVRAHDSRTLNTP